MYTSKPKPPIVVNTSDYPTEFLTSLVKLSMYVADFNEPTFVAQFKLSDSTYVYKGTGNKNKIVLYLATRKKRYKNIFPLDLNNKGIVFQNATSHTVRSRIELLAFIIAHEIKHAKGYMGEAVCNESAWKFVQYYRKNRWRILRCKPM